ncbi:SMI1/KNR4 family protein [Photobacterium sp. 1_MG-2023]|uniref:SMI1/KNR4 family protein n=1 Tax=Photobacterium sp. 1_MG-2023 TaxID=3062646 RepID=UPI0026E2014C|nr:SMI1/KNR4 family protein [Photobacterium sp. 1_MG-2023]MDO6705098.1 SMI1/KNR4 family protein [Photobacterium sp. 1_MG-2023]
MIKIKFDPGSSAEPFTDSRLEDIQEYLDEFVGGVSLPQALIEMLKENNGGVPIHRYFETESDAYPLRIFFNMSRNEPCILHESNNIFDMHQLYEDRFNNPYLLPIAETSFGDVVVLDYEGTPKDNPRVALWFHECDEHGVNSQPLEHIADDMASFLDLLTED